MILTILTSVSLLCALIPALLFFRNLHLYKKPPRPLTLGSVSVIIPARNEERCIADCVRAVLASEAIRVNVIVLDDHSDDNTAQVVREIERTDSRVRLIEAPPLPAGWCGKQFACFVAAHFANDPVLCFLDSDVRLEREGLARMYAALREGGAPLISGFPRQITNSPLEQLILPLMHFLLLGFLPLDRMRRSLQPSLGAGCGQLFLAERDIYWKVGGHETIKSSRHDGLTLPRAFRKAGFPTDLWDATEIANCRMYRSAGEVIFGLLKNATEGLAAPQCILPFSTLLFFGQVLPIALWIASLRGCQSIVLRTMATISLFASYAPRLVAVYRFRQQLIAALFHPLSVILFLLIEWTAFFASLFHIQFAWKGRRYSTS
jgi:glycosyltransferase involved in cell wall biosynthesis